MPQGWIASPPARNDEETAGGASGLAAILDCHPRPERRSRGGEGDPDLAGAGGLDPLPAPLLGAPGMTRQRRAPRQCIVAEWASTASSSRATILVILMAGFTAGPAVSL
jgi:hypothetical protein